MSEIESQRLTDVYAKVVLYHNNHYMGECAPLYERIKYEQELRMDFIKNNKSDVEIREVVVLFCG